MRLIPKSWRANLDSPFLLLFLVTSLLTGAVSGAPLFNTITIPQFGGTVNQNLPLQPQNRLNPFEPIRTNDFQALQQIAANSGQIIRVNQFYVSQGPTGVGLTFPATQTNLNLEITTPTDNAELIFGCTESADLGRRTHFFSTQAMSIAYRPKELVAPTGATAATPTSPALPPATPGPAPFSATPPTTPIPTTPAQPPGPALPSNFIANFPAEPTPVAVPSVPQLFQVFFARIVEISTNGPTIHSIIIDGTEVALPNTSRPVTLPPGNQFVITLDNGQLFFLNVVNSLDPLQLVINSGRTLLVSKTAFTGRLAWSNALVPLQPKGLFNEFQFNNLSPVLVTNGPTIDTIVIDGVPVNSALFIPPPGRPFGALPAGHTFDLTLSNGDHWLIQINPAISPISFVINPERTLFRSTTDFSATLTFSSRQERRTITLGQTINVGSTNATFFTLIDTVSGSRAESGSFVDYNVIGNAYHDIEYNGLTPLITFSQATLQSFFVDGVRRPLPSGSQSEAGRKFKFVFDNGQTWLVYVEQSIDPISLIATNNGRVQAAAPFVGILRVAVIQTTPVENIGPVVRNPQVGRFWSTAADTQTSPVTPISPFLLWPQQWVTKVDAQIVHNIQRGIFVPTCGIVAELLPLLARRNFTAASRYFQSIHQVAYPLGLNRFNNFFLLLLTNNLSASIDSYQSASRPSPSYGIVPSAALTEASYDAYRHTIPLTADIFFSANSYEWAYSCIGGAINPLILFPAYKRLDPTLHSAPIPAFAVLDPIKGPLLGVSAVNGMVSFQEGPLPSFYATDYIPPTLAFKGQELSRLQSLFKEVQAEIITATTLPETGQQLFELALSVKIAQFVFARIPGVSSFIKSFTQPLIDQIKTTLNQWLITHVDAQGNPLPDSFTGDTLTPGVVSTSGVLQTTNATEQLDQGNAIYNVHHSQYGLWLGAAAIVIQWDDLFNTQDPWIAQLISTTDKSSIVKRKVFMDMLWRDSRNPDKEDIAGLPFNRHGNPWEGHSTDSGTLYTPLAQGRLEESLALDFNSWVGVDQYAKAILATPALDAADKAGFDILQTFAEANMQLTATSGKLYYQDNNWLYTLPYAINLTVGMEFDTQTEAATTLQPGSPSCQLLTR